MAATEPRLGVRPDLSWGVAESRVERFPAAGAAVSAEVFPAPGETGVVLGHGAGGNRENPLLREVAAGLAAAGFPSALYNFPYAEAGKKAPDRPPVLERAAAESAGHLAGILGTKRLFLGGKSMGGRIAAQAVVAGKIEAPGLLFLGYPLHAAGQDSDWGKRAALLGRLTVPALFLQGSKDRLCNLDHLRQAIAGIPATLHVVAGGDHSLNPPKAEREGATDRLVHVILAWLGGV